jgi:putative ABC transport system permease protein
MMSRIMDLRYAIRMIRRQPRYAVIAILTMALGIGAATTLFTVVNGVLMKPLPWPSASRLIVVKETRGGRPPRFNSFSNAAYLAWREGATAVEDMAAWSTRNVTLSGAGDPDRIRVTAATASLFSTLGARPLIGSFFDASDEVRQNGSAIVLAERLWRQRFGAEPSVLGRVVRLDGEPYTVVGVLPDRLAYPDSSSVAFVPFRVMPAANNYLSMFNVIARMRPGVTSEQAASEGTARGRHAPDSGMTTMAIFGGTGPIEITATSLTDALTADVRRPLLVLFVAVALLLATATTNVANLQLARATTRQREIAIRAALGAGRGRVMRQLLTESLLLGLLGGSGGLVLALALQRSIPTILPADFPRADAVSMDTTVVVFAILASVVTSVLFGLFPALRVRDVNLVQSLTEDGTAPVGGGSRSRTAQARAAIMAAQVAIACVLLVGASLLGRSFLTLLNTDRGYDPSGLLTARLSLPSSLFSPERRHAIVDQVLARLSTLPAVTHAAFTSELPITAGGSTSAFTLPSRTAAGGTVSVQASPRLVSPRALPALGMRLIAGRDFADADTATSLPVVIVNRAFAHQYLADNAIGEHLPMGVGYQDADQQATIIGVVDDVRYPGGTRVTQPEMYYSYRQLGGKVVVPVVTLLVRTSADPNALSAAVRAAVREADAGLVPDAVTTMEARLLTTLARPRLYAILLGGYATLGLLIAAVGLFGVLSYTVALRTRELAVRAALGAQQSDIIRLVLRQTLGMMTAGLAAGLLASLLLSRSTAALLYGITPYDTFTFVAVPVVLGLAAIAACVGPALRAARLDPLRALRS